MPSDRMIFATVFSVITSARSLSSAVILGAPVDAFRLLVDREDLSFQISSSLLSFFQSGCHTATLMFVETGGRYFEQACHPMNCGVRALRGHQRVEFYFC